MKRTTEKKSRDAFASTCTQANLKLNTYWILVILRILLTLLPQNGYIHPDEHFQSLEVFAGDVFNYEVDLAWEFNSSFPVRSIVLPFFTVGVPYITMKHVEPFTKLWFDFSIVTPYTLLVVPRLVICCLSFICDYSLYKICYAYGQNYKARLMMLASSFVILVYGSRTFSNTLEMILFSLLLYFVADSMCCSDQIIYQDETLRDKYDSASTIVDKVKWYKLRNTLPSHSIRYCFQIALITVAGIFNRPTFFAFAFAPVFFWLQRGLGSKYVGLAHFHLRIALFMMWCLMFASLFIAIDSFYFGYLTINDILNLKMDIKNFVVTPANFILYNMKSANLAKHGLHPRYLHLLINVPLLYNVIGVVGLFSFFKMIHTGLFKKWSSLPRVQSIFGLMMASFIVPVFALSFFEHQEPRFLIPVTVPLLFLHSQKIRTNERFTRLALGIWYTLNILLCLFFGFIHQAGVYPLVRELHSEIQMKPKLTNVHIVTSHAYSVPWFLLQLKSTKRSRLSLTGKRYRVAREVYFYELGSKPLEDVHTRLVDLLDSCEERRVKKHLNYILYFVMPGTLYSRFESVVHDLNYTITNSFYPHISTEALPQFDDDCRVNKNQEVFCDTFQTHWLKKVMELGLLLIRINR